MEGDFHLFWQLPSVCGVIQVTLSNNSLYFLLICCFSAFWLFQGLPLTRLELSPWSWRTWNTLSLGGDGTEKNRLASFSTNTFYVNFSMRDEIQEVHMQFLHEPFEVFIHIVEKKRRNTQNLFCSSATPNIFIPCFTNSGEV